MTKHYTLTEAQLQTMIGWMRHHTQRCANALENLIPSDDYETVKAALETEREAANLYAKQVAHWMHKHDELLQQQLAAPVPKEWTDENVIAWCIERGIKNTSAPWPGTKLVSIRQLFDHEGNQVCNLGHETCHFYVLPTSGGLCGASCNHCQRGIPNNKPHRLCPVLYESKK